MSGVVEGSCLTGTVVVTPAVGPSGRRAGQEGRRRVGSGRRGVRRLGSVGVPGRREVPSTLSRRLECVIPVPVHLPPS